MRTALRVLATTRCHDDLAAMAPGQTRKVRTEQTLQAAGEWAQAASLWRRSLVAESRFRLSAAQRYTCVGARVKKRALKGAFEC